MLSNAAKRKIVLSPLRKKQQLSCLHVIRVAVFSGMNQPGRRVEICRIYLNRMLLMIFLAVALCWLLLASAVNVTV
jgi:hypothetical protein